MGIETMKYKIIGWMVSAFFCGLAGGIMGGLVGYMTLRMLLLMEERWVSSWY